jgi:YlmC/YmxH family sporulation protein
MNLRMSELHCKEVICISNGQRLGFVSDVEIRCPEGEVCAILVPGPCRIMGVLGRNDDYIIPWSCIKKIGPDIILVDAKPEDCRVHRPKQRFL